MFELIDFSVSVDTKQLIKSLSITLNKNDKLAIIGEEGNGKSTLLKAILGLCDYAKVEGKINLHGQTIGYLPQKLDEYILNKTVFEYLFETEENYYNKINNFYKYLDELLLSDDKISEPIKNLSGGEKVKFLILKLILEDHDILLLDEPTNDLDIKTLNWLETFIKKSKKIIIYVSHDETLLSNTANIILHLELVKHKAECKHTIERLSYDEYVYQRLSKIEKEKQEATREQRDFQKQKQKLNQIMSKVEYQQNTISRSDPHGAKLLKKKMHQLKSQEKRLNNKAITCVPVLEEEINFFFDEIFIPNTKIILNLFIPKLQVKDKIISSNINLFVKGNEHIAIVGENGIGKSTLLKSIYDHLKTRTDIKVGYMPQNYNEILNKYEYVLDFLLKDKSKEELTKAQIYLGNMNFTKEEMASKISNLSNGTIAKLFFVKFALEQNNVLLLDEPTRNISPLSNPIIRKALREFKGTIISVSHDRKYIKEVVDSIYLLEKEGLKKINKI